MSETKTALTPFQSKVANVRDLLERNKTQIALALPKHMTIDRVMRIVLTEINKVPQLLDCTPKSLLGAIHEGARLGLEFGGVMGQAYLIPFNNRKTGQKEVQFIAGYRGLISLARRGGEVSSIKADVIHEKDFFDPDANNEKGYTHVRFEFTKEGIALGRKADPGPVIGAYAVARFINGGYHVEMMSLRELDAIKSRSKASSSGPWVTDTEEMQKKTVARRLCKWLPMSVELARAISLSDAADEGEGQGLDITGMQEPIDIEAVEPEQLEGPKESTLDKLAAAHEDSVRQPTDVVPAEAEVVPMPRVSKPGPRRD